MDSHFWQFPAITERTRLRAPCGLAAPYGVRVHSWQLVAANVVNADRREGLEPGRPLQARSRLASFVGAHMPHYRSQVRLRLREEVGRAPALASGGVHAPAPGGVHGAVDVVVELTDKLVLRRALRRHRAPRAGGGRAPGRGGMCRRASSDAALQGVAQRFGVFAVPGRRGAEHAAAVGVARGGGDPGGDRRGLGVAFNTRRGLALGG